MPGQHAGPPSHHGGGPGGPGGRGPGGPGGRGPGGGFGGPPMHGGRGFGGPPMHGGHRPPPPPRGYRRGGCMGCALPVITAVAVISAAVVMLIISIL